MGLTLAKHLVERMGGEITVASTVGVGSTFTVLLPLTEAVTDFEPDLPARIETPALHGALRILHVEDNLANLALVEQILARHQEVELIAATLGGLALELARRHRPDVILLDLHLPDMSSGVDVLGPAAGFDPTTTAHFRVVVVSADATAERMAMLDAQRVAAYLTKPIDVRQLLKVIESVAQTLTGPVTSTPVGLDGRRLERRTAPVKRPGGQGMQSTAKSSRSRAARTGWRPWSSLRPRSCACSTSKGRSCGATSRWPGSSATR